MNMNMNKVDCSNVYVKEIKKNDQIMNGVFAKKDFKKDDIVEYGIASKVNADGHKNPHFFTWSDNIPNLDWAICSGCSAFYNTSLNPTTKMERDFKNNTFKIYALRDIKKDEELTHLYKSIKWRNCFSGLYDIIKN